MTAVSFPARDKGWHGSVLKHFPKASILGKAMPVRAQWVGEADAVCGMIATRSHKKMSPLPKITLKVDVDKI